MLKEFNCYIIIIFFTYQTVGSRENKTLIRFATDCSVSHSMDLTDPTIFCKESVTNFMSNNLITLNSVVIFDTKFSDVSQLMLLLNLHLKVIQTPSLAL